MSSILTSAPPSPRASSLIDSNALEQPAGQANIELPAKRTRHSQYYFKDGNVVFLVEEVLYNVHCYFFERDSAHFRTILENAEGADETRPITLFDVNCSDFDEFLAILYPTNFRRPAEKITAQWTSILHLAAKWGFESIQLLAIDNLTASAIPVDKIVLGRRYGILDWLPGAYEAVCTRADPLTVEEGVKLGVEDVVRISAARQVYGCAKARYETKHLLEDLGDIFGLEMPTEEVSGGSADAEENDIKDLEDQIVAVQAEFAALPPAIITCDRHPTYGQDTCLLQGNRTSCAGCLARRKSDETSCTGCLARKESAGQRLKQEEEAKERRLADLREKRDRMAQLARKPERMTLFR
ncbi:hypothetical protein FIBSPDRAFT_855546 [Athelia psychrophila]|uniref:BTB domain-containing protein n=1 Tax=Athelia psychrophila TaxID=1759441 RepID=A0A166P1T1_9AGAM|nr:hypothetical protein FIBSPDRAFT_855546 [Fibularhizoctonia sp. CBS 109695]